MSNLEVFVVYFLAYFIYDKNDGTWTVDWFNIFMLTISFLSGFILNCVL